MATLEQLFNFLGQGWVGSVIGLVSLLLALVLYVLYRRARIGPRLVYQRRATYLISSGQSALPHEVSISFKGVVVSRLTASYIVLWNAGTETVRGSDVVTADPLRFVFAPRTEVLRARVVCSTRSVIEFQASTSPHAPNEALWGFDYMDPGDGAVMEILHTGEERYAQVRGTIRGMPEGIKDWGFPDWETAGGRLPRSILISPILGIIMGAVFLALGFSMGPVSLRETGLNVKDIALTLGWVFLALIAIQMALLAVLPLRRRWRRFPRSLLTNELG